MLWRRDNQLKQIIWYRAYFNVPTGTDVLGKLKSMLEDLVSRDWRKQQSKHGFLNFTLGNLCSTKVRNKSLNFGKFTLHQSTHFPVFLPPCRQKTTGNFVNVIKFDLEFRGTHKEKERRLRRNITEHIEKAMPPNHDQLSVIKQCVKYFTPTR